MDIISELLTSYSKLRYAGKKVGTHILDTPKGDTVKNITEPIQHMKHPSAVEKLNDLLIVLKLGGMSNDLLVKPSEFGEPINESRLIEILSEVRDEISQCKGRIEIKHLGES